jgi:hypothetical protein
MANLTLRQVKGSPLTIAEMDGNFEYFTGSHAITGSLIVTGGITGSISGDVTASYLSPLQQDVQLTGSLTINGGAFMNLTTQSVPFNYTYRIQCSISWTYYTILVQ